MARACYVVCCFVLPYIGWMESVIFVGVGERDNRDGTVRRYGRAGTRVELLTIIATPTNSRNNTNIIIQSIISITYGILPVQIYVKLQNFGI